MHGLSVLSHWCSHFSSEVPKVLVDAFKVRQKINIFTDLNCKIVKTDNFDISCFLQTLFPPVEFHTTTTLRVCEPVKVLAYNGQLIYHDKD